MIFDKKNDSNWYIVSFIIIFMMYYMYYMIYSSLNWNSIINVELKKTKITNIIVPIERVI